VVANVVDIDGAEGAGADVQDELRPLYAPSIETVEELLGEVQTRGRGGDAPGLAGVDRLVAVSVAGGIGATDVRREGDVPVLLDGLGRIELFGEEANGAHRPR
jgi:hypothetical protein